MKKHHLIPATAVACLVAGIAAFAADSAPVGGDYGRYDAHITAGVVYVTDRKTNTLYLYKPEKNEQGLTLKTSFDLTHAGETVLPGTKYGEEE